MKPLYLRLLTFVIGTFTAWYVAKAEFEETRAVVFDDVGNLIGDESRSYLDIRELKIRKIAGQWCITVFVNGNFPNPDFMLGTGFRFNFDFLNSTAHTETPPDYLFQIRVMFGSADWQIDAYADIESHQPMDMELELETTVHTLTICLPNERIEKFNQLRVSATTNDFPKWTPITVHPPVSMNLERQTSADVRLLSD